LPINFKHQKIGLLGAGSWGTAIASIITNKHNLNWWVRREDQINQIQTTSINKHYLPTLKLPTSKISFSSSLEEVISNSSILIIAIPSEYIDEYISEHKATLKDKIIISAVKGVIPVLNVTPYQYFKAISKDLVYGVISGPCHAEEVALKKKSYLTLSFKDESTSKELISMFSTDYINIKPSSDIIGTELAAILKNIYALVTGVCFGLGYGDNFLAVIITASTNEMKRLLFHLDPIERSVSKSAYLGDLLVTCYSLHSRNRRFGAYIGKGYSVSATKAEMKMVAEGYNATNCIYEIIKKRGLVHETPIINAAYEILYNNSSPKNQMNQLSELIH